VLVQTCWPIVSRVFLRSSRTAPTASARPRTYNLLNVVVSWAASVCARSSPNFQTLDP